MPLHSQHEHNLPKPAFRTKQAEEAAATQEVKFRPIAVAPTNCITSSAATATATPHSGGKAVQVSGELEPSDLASAGSAAGECAPFDVVHFDTDCVSCEWFVCVCVCVCALCEGAMHESAVTLQGYMYFYHLLLAFVQKYPELQVAY